MNKSSVSTIGGLTLLVVTFAISVAFEVWLVYLLCYVDKHSSFLGWLIFLFGIFVASLVSKIFDIVSDVVSD